MKRPASALLALLVPTALACPNPPRNPTVGSPEMALHETEARPDAGSAGEGRGDAHAAAISADATVVVGSTVVDGPPTSEAERLNRRGLALHAAGGHDEAVALFRSALDQAPGYDVARYNMACALALGGDLVSAEREIAALVQRDPPRFLPRLDDDEDLAALRAHPELRRLRQAVEEAWRRAVRAGLPAMVFDDRGTTAPGPEGSCAFHRTFARAGAYLHEERRFVPTTPPVEHGTTPVAFEDRAVAVGRASVCMNSAAEHVWSFLGARVFSLEHPGRVLADGGAAFGVVRLCATEDGAVVVGGHPDPEDGEARELPARRLTGDGASATGEPRCAPDAAIVRVAPTFGVPDRHGAGIGELRGTLLALPGHDPIRLGPGHAAVDAHDIARSPDDRFVTVVSVRATACGERDARHFADLIDLQSRGVRRLSQGRGSAAARFDRAGTLYLQVRDGLQVYPTLPGLEHEVALPGVRLAMPVLSEGRFSACPE